MFPKAVRKPLKTRHLCAPARFLAGVAPERSICHAFYSASF